MPTLKETKYIQRQLFTCPKCDILPIWRQLQFSTKMVLPASSPQGDEDNKDTLSLRANFFREGDNYHLLLSNDERRRVIKWISQSYQHLIK